MKAAILILFAAFVLTSAAAASSSRAQVLRAREALLVRQVEHAKTTFRFFGNHPKLLYSPSGKDVRRDRTGRRAWHAVNEARAIFIRARAKLVVVRRSLQALRHPLIVHRADWLCIYSHENGGYGWRANTGNGYFGGLQMDLEFQRDYGAALLRQKGTADHWTPDEQMAVAERALRTRGFWPWPRTARMCGLL